MLNIISKNERTMSSLDDELDVIVKEVISALVDVGLNATSIALHRKLRARRNLIPHREPLAV